MRVGAVRREDADGRTQELLAEYEAEHGKRPALWDVLANYPPLLEAHASFFRATILEGSLD